MRISESWLREWVNPTLTCAQLCERLTMAGLEVESIISLAEFIKADTNANIFSSFQQDNIIDIAITPNRGDCLSIKGLAREIAALTQVSWTPVVIPTISAKHQDQIPIKLIAEAQCPRYVGRVIRDVNVQAATPQRLKQRLHVAGIRLINPIVDITNYVMIELGQPMHAFDLDTIHQELQIRLAQEGESIHLLDGSEKILDVETLIIADKERPLAIAGVMGGLDSGVTMQTQSIFLESAFFDSLLIARQRQFYGLNSESAYRFERYVDPTIQRDAIERATQLILEIAGGKADDVIEVFHEKYIPNQYTLTISYNEINSLLGTEIPQATIESIFTALKFNFQKKDHTLIVTIPSYRPDLRLLADLAEEVARFYGYEKIPTHLPLLPFQINQAQQTIQDNANICQLLRDQGFHEIISYGFVDKNLQFKLNSAEPPLELLNPISAEMAAMRSTLWPGLVQTLIYNASRQQERVRIFEIGACFKKNGQEIVQETKLAGLISGLVYQEQWGIQKRGVDFFDLKGALENVLRLFYHEDEYRFKSENIAACHPGQTAGVYIHKNRIGVIGALHPAIIQTMGLPRHVFVFELDLAFLKKKTPHAHEFSKFPEIRRDIAILIDQGISSKHIQDTIRQHAGEWLKEIFTFDVYQGKGVASGLKSIALALILQHPTRTLVDEEVVELMNQVMAALKEQLGAELRS